MKTCAYCGASFARPLGISRSRWGRTRFCSKQCVNRNPKSALERFEASFCPEPNSGCYLWTAASQHKFGYGTFRLDDERHHEGAHRASWMLYRGPIPDGAYVLHKCDVPACVNPDHLFLGDHASNTADRIMKGRSRAGRGEKNGHAKLTDAAVIEIRGRLEMGERRLLLALEFGVARSTINMIGSNKTWRHIPAGIGRGVSWDRPDEQEKAA